MSNHMVNMQQMDSALRMSTTNPNVYVSSKMGLDDLFQTLNGEAQVTSLPMRERNLPASFFRPPSNSSSVAHSRDSSLDASGFSPQHVSKCLGSPLTGKPPVHHLPGHAQHQRQVSSPVASSSAPSSACSPVHHQAQHSSPSPLSPPSPGCLKPTPNIISHHYAHPHYHHHPSATSSPAQLPHSSLSSSSSSSPSSSFSASAMATPMATTMATPTPAGLAGIIHARTRSLPASLQQFTCQGSPSSSPLGNMSVSNNTTTTTTTNNNNVVLSSTPANQQAVSQQQQQLQHANLVAITNNGQHGRQHSFDVLVNHYHDLNPNNNHNSNNLLQAQQQQQQHQQQQTLYGRYQPFGLNCAMHPNGSLPSISQFMPRQSQAQPQQSESLHLLEQQQLALPQGWQAASTATGDVYFINEQSRTSTWLHPSVPKQMQIKSVQQKQHNSSMMVPPQFQPQSQNIPAELVMALENMHTSSENNNTSNDNLLNLQLECERYKQRQEQIRSTPSLKSNYLEHSLSSNVNTDPFLSGGSAAGVPPTATPILINGSMAHNLANTNGNDAQFVLDFNQNLTTMNNGEVNNSSETAGHNQGLEDMAFDNFELEHLMDGIDLLNDVEELLNSNKDNLMTWL